MFSAIVPLKSQVSWRTIPVLERSSSRVIDAMSMPSRVIRPESTS